MARHSADREDLMAEAVALSPRVALVVPGYFEDIVAGFHADGRWSVFFGGDPVYHFDALNRLRRAFVAGDLYRTQGTTLARLRRQVTPSETVLLRRDLDPAEVTEFWSTLRTHIHQLASAIKLKTAVTKQAIPENTECVSELLSRIELVLRNGCALAPTMK